MTRDTNESALEISGPASAKLLETFADISDNSLLALYGRIVETNTSENSDKHTTCDVIRAKIVLKSWMLECSSGEELMCLDNPELIGLLRFRRYNEILSPSYRDRAIIRMLTQLQQNCVFITAAEETTDCLGIKYKMMGYKVKENVKETLTNKVNMIIPCLGAKSEYRHEPVNATSQSLIEGKNTESSNFHFYIHISFSRC